MKKVLPYPPNEIKNAKSKGKWGHFDIPIFSVSTMNEFILERKKAILMKNIGMDI